MTQVDQAPSASIAQPDYWWYRARAELLRKALEPYVGDPARVLDVGSADGPSVDWMRGFGWRVSLDLDPSGLEAGGVCGSAMALPFADESFDVVAAFDVVEHCDPERDALAELVRVLRPGGRLMVSVPAYQWAWTLFDVDAGHYRRYTQRRLRAAISRSGLEIARSTYIFGGTLPFFVAERVLRRLKGARGQRSGGLPQPHQAVERILLGLCRLDGRLLNLIDLPFGSSVVVAATKSNHR